MKKIISVILSCLIMAGMSFAAVLPAEQAPIEGGCGGGGVYVPPEEPVEIPEADPIIPLPAPILKYHAKPTSFKYEWVQTKQDGCKIYSAYQTYQVGVCEPGVMKCNIKLYSNKIRMSWMPNCYEHY